MALARLSLSRRPPALVRSNRKTPHDLHTASFTAYMTLRPSSARYDLFSKVEKEKKLRKKFQFPLYRRLHKETLGVSGFSQSILERFASGCSFEIDISSGMVYGKIYLRPGLNLLCMINWNHYLALRKSSTYIWVKSGQFIETTLCSRQVSDKSGRKNEKLCCPRTNTTKIT